MMPTSEMPKIRLFEMRCETHTVRLANSLLMRMASNYLLLILMENLYEKKAFNYYENWRKNIINNSSLDWEETADQLRYLHNAVESMPITEGDKGWDQQQDLLNFIETDIDYADSQ
jgi:hypothetical protein